MAWTYLVLAGLLEIGWASSLKQVEGFTRLWPTLFFFFCLVASILLLGRAARELPIGTAYAVWTGIGAAGTVLVGILVYKEPATALRVLCLTTLIASIIGLRLTTPT
jgi:quaternary ammonium compound-resistance protein SugE